MKRVVLAFLLPVVVAACVALCGFQQAASSAAGPSCRVFFSPKGGCTDAIVNALGEAKESVVVQAYSFTSAPIAEALVEAFRRGVRVEVILDKSQRTEKYSSADFLVHSRIPTRIDAKHAIAHNKVMVIDGRIVITGSFNFTKAAEERNAENLLVVEDVALAAKYAANWASHQEHSDVYEGKAAPPVPLLKPKEEGN